MGNDGRRYFVAITSTGVQRWQLLPAGWLEGAGRRKGRTVACIDNGGSPFHVFLTTESGPGHADVSAQVPGGLYQPWRSFGYERVFIGLDPEERRSPAAWWHGGNSVLLQLRGPGQDGMSVYVFIGEEVYSFIPKDPILRYVSTMGNSTVPYPYALGEENTYLMIENTFVPNELLIPLASKYGPDPYAIFYSSGFEASLPRGRRDTTRVFKESHKIPRRVILHKRNILPFNIS